MKAPNFDRLARVYRWMEIASFGPTLWWCRCTFLSEMKSSRRALVLGDGDGRFTAKLLRTNAQIRVDAIDVSAKMLQALERRSTPNADRLRTFPVDARELDPTKMACDPQSSDPYDLVVAHFFLDCLTTEEVRRLALAVRPALSADARWVVSEFANPEGWKGRLVAGPIIGFLYWAFGWMTGLRIRHLPNHAEAFGEAGFILVWTRRRLGGLLVSQLWERHSHF